MGMQEYEQWEKRFTKIEDILTNLWELSVRQRDFAQAALWEKEGMHGFERWQKQRKRLVQQLESQVIKEKEKPLLQQEALQNARQTHDRKCRELAAMIEANDALTRNSLIQGMDKLSAKISGVRNSKKARKAYSQSVMENAWFFDKKK